MKAFRNSNTTAEISSLRFLCKSECETQKVATISLIIDDDSHILYDVTNI